MSSAGLASAQDDTRTNIVESNAGQPVDSCVLDVIDAIEFPPPSDGRTFTVRYPMIFVTGN